jgi:DNA-3-methyladenine glycosylase
LIKRLRKRDLPVDTEALARYLIGKVLVHELPEGRVCGRVVETEAYPPGDASGHAFAGETKRNSSLWLDRGHAYVYFIYGNWYCLNVSSERNGVGAGVLFRAIEPVDGIEIMERFRGTTRVHDLARGPGRLAQAMDITRHQDGVDLCTDRKLYLASIPQPARKIGASVRIGITREVDRPLRFYERGNPFVSGPKRLSP